MCDRTVEGTDIETLRAVPGEDGEDRTVSGQDFGWRNVSGINGGVALLGTTPTFTEITNTGTTSYTSPVGCVYIEVYLIARGGTADGGTVSVGRTSGSGAGCGGVCVGFYAAGTYAMDINDASSFGTMTAAVGGFGVSAVSLGITYVGGANGATTNSVYSIGYSPAIPPGNTGGNGGGSFVAGLIGRGLNSTTSGPGVSGRMGSGGGGGSNNNPNGGSGLAERLRVIEYY